jgi:hypothetical protein
MRWLLLFAGGRMAGEWLKFECSLPEKPETMAITAAMGWDDTDLTVGKLMRLFRWFDQQTLDGNAIGVTPALLDKVIGVTGFVQAVIAVRWLTVTENGLALHNFDRHNGLTAKSRAQTAKRVANFRSKDVPDQTLSGGNAATVTPALAKEEKRREEKKKTGESAARSSRKCPDGFAITEDMRRWVSQTAPVMTDAGLQRETDKFRDHTFKTAISDWPGAWRNWIRRATEGRAPAAAAPNKFSAAAAGIFGAARPEVIDV